MRISKQDRKSLQLLQRQALMQGKKYQRRIIKERLKQIRGAIDKLAEIPISKWVDFAPSLIDESYLNNILPKIYREAGTPSAKFIINKILNRKEDIWESSLSNWININAGKKVKIIEGSLKEWFGGELTKVLEMSDELGRLGVEEMTGVLYDNLKTVYPDLMEWQVRRIVQTESLTATSVASKSAVDDLGIPVTAIWASSGLPNSRPSHAAMDGQEADETGMFYLDGQQMEYPRDDRFGADAGDIINCACSVIYYPK